MTGRGRHAQLLRVCELPGDVMLVLHERNRGKGAALQTALEHEDWHLGRRARRLF